MKKDGYVDTYKGFSIGDTIRIIGENDLDGGGDSHNFKIGEIGVIDKIKPSNSYPFMGVLNNKDEERFDLHHTEIEKVTLFKDVSNKLDQLIVKNSTPI